TIENDVRIQNDEPASASRRLSVLERANPIVAGLDRERSRYRPNGDVRPRAPELFHHWGEPRIIFAINQDEFDKRIGLAENRANRAFDLLRRTMHGHENGNHPIRA